MIDIEKSPEVKGTKKKTRDTEVKPNKKRIA